MKILGNGNGASLASSTMREECSTQCRKGRKLVLDLSSLVCVLTILSAKLRVLLSLNTITRRFLTSQEFHKYCISDVPSY
jgi:hypothetical protein